MSTHPEHGFDSCAELVRRNPWVFAHPWGALPIHAGLKSHRKHFFVFIQGGFSSPSSRFFPIHKNIVKVAGPFHNHSGVFYHLRWMQHAPPTKPRHPHKALAGRPEDPKGQARTPKHSRSARKVRLGEVHAHVAIRIVAPSGPMTFQTRPTGDRASCSRSPPEVRSSRPTSQTNY